MTARGSRNVVRKAIEYLPSVIIPALCNVLLIALFGRRLGTSQMGYYYLAQSVINIGAILAGSWLQQSILRFESGTLLARHRSFHRAIFAVVPITGALFMGGAVAVTALTHADVPLGRLIACLVVAEAWYRLLLAVLQAQGRSRTYSLAMSLVAIGRLLLGLVFFRLGMHDSTCLFLGWLTSEVLVCALLFFVLGYHDAPQTLVSDVGGPGAGGGFWLRLREYSEYGLPMLGFVLLSELRPFTDRMVLSHLLERSAVGIHGSNYALGINSVGLLSMPLMLAVHPYLMGLANRPDFDPRDFARRTSELARAFLLLSTMLVLGVVPLSRLASHVALGAKFEEGFRILSLAALGSVFSGLVVYLSKGLEARKNTRMMLACNVSAYALSAGVNIVCVHELGLIGAAIGFAVGSALYCVIVWAATDPEIRAPLPIGAVAAFVVAYAVAFAVPELLGASWLAAAFSICASAACLLILYTRGELARLRRYSEAP